MALDDWERCPNCGSEDLARFGLTPKRTEADVTDVIECQECAFQHMNLAPALADLWALYGAECEHGVGLDQCERCEDEARTLNEIRPAIAAACGVEVEPAP